MQLGETVIILSRFKFFLLHLLILGMLLEKALFRGIFLLLELKR